MNNITVGEKNGGNMSMMNMSSNRGLNTTMNFIKSSHTLTKCKEKLSNSNSKNKLVNLNNKVMENTNVLNSISSSLTKWRKSKRISK